jgi:hypothetical protein
MDKKLVSFYERGKREILSDIATGVLPRSVTRFSALHDYVDANTYCGFADDGVLCGCPPDGPCLGDCGGQVTIAEVDEVQCALDRWLRDGRP